MLYDSFDRKIDYLRLSVTDRCNLRCRYCMPEDGVPYIPHEEVMRFEEIVEVVRTAASLGVGKLRLTGGEPLVRRGIVDLTAMLAEIEGIEDFGMTTNGTLLGEYAGDLKRAGLDRVNISLDSLDPDEYQHITRVGDLSAALDGIFAARDAGLFPIKLNVVVPAGIVASEYRQARDVAEFGKKHGFQVRYIRQMDLGSGEFTVVEGGSGGDCARCNRLRLSSRGIIHPCLFSDLGFDVRKLGPREAVLAAVREKPARGIAGSTNTFYGLGG